MDSKLEHESILKATADLVLQDMLAQGADEGECWVGRTAMTEIYYEAQKISMVRTVYTDTIQLKLLQGKRKGSLSLNGFDPTEVKHAVSQALEASRSASEDDAEGVAELVESQSLFKGPAKPDLEKMYTLLETFFADAKSGYPLVGFDGVTMRHMNVEKRYANTRGATLNEQHGVYEFGGMIMARDGDKVSSFNGFGGATFELDTPMIERDGVRRSLKEIQEQIETGEVKGSFVGELILAPNMLGEVLWYAKSLFLDDAALISGNSIWKEKLGEQVSDSKLTWYLSPNDPELPGAGGLTGDGYVAENHTLIEKGVLKRFSLSRYGAAKTGGTRAGNTSTHFVVEPGTDHLADMIASVGKGLILNRFSGGMPGASGDLTGVVKNSYLIEDGRVVGPVSETMLSANIPEMLKNILMLSVEVESDGISRLPWAKVGGVTISGK